MSDRRDNLSECNNLKVPVEDFKLFWCNRCLQPECTRSLYGKTKFEQRVTTWLDRLFLNVPRMDTGDPRFSDISRKEFHPVLDSWEISSEVPTEKEQSDQPVSFLAMPSDEVLIQEANGSGGTDEPSENEVPVKNEAVKSHLATPSKGHLEVLILMNTPNRSGLYLPGGGQDPFIESSNDSGRGGKPSVKVVSKNDPWAAPEQKHPSEVVVEAGATIRLGGSKSGVEGK